MFDLAAYRARVGIAGEAGLSALHRAHLRAIPFENLDPFRGRIVSLDLETIQAKLVGSHRGGYCFEQNLLLKAAVEASGLGRVSLHLARSPWNIAPEVAMPRTHLVLAVDDGTTLWHADVGFGPGSILEPIPFGPGGPYEQSGWRLRVREDAGQLILQTDLRGDWRDVYAVDPAPAEMIDLELANWWVSTHPTSHFVRGLTVGIVQAGGSHVTLRGTDELELVTRTATVSERELVSWAAVPELLQTRFGLGGFRLADGRLIAGGA